MSGVSLELLTKFVAASETHPRTVLFYLKQSAEEITENPRLKVCCHHRVPGKTQVELWYSDEAKRAYYLNLMKCGLAWVCPLCAKRMSEIRRQMLRAALDNSRTLYFPVMVTYTVQHNRGDRLASLLGGMNEAYRKMRMQRSWRLYKEDMQIEGETRATEATYGENGWHPHYHVVLWLKIGVLRHFTKASGDIDAAALCADLETQIFKHWAEALEKEGLYAMQGVGVNVRSSWELLDEYVTKSGEVLPQQGEGWGIAEETTKTQFKTTKTSEGKTPWQLLIDATCGDEHARILFKEYHDATKGKSGLQWTPGLKAKLGITTEELAALMENAKENENDYLLASFSPDDWRVIISTGATGAVLDAARTGELTEVSKILDKARTMYNTSVPLLLGPYD